MSRDASHAVEANVQGRFPATTVFADVPDLLPALARFPGESAWTAALIVDASPDPAGGRKRLTLASDLRGIAIDLPSPLTKSADAREPFELRSIFRSSVEMFSAKLGDLVSARGRLSAPGKPFAARVSFGRRPTGEICPTRRRDQRRRWRHSMPAAGSI